jgi:hypothetical protein
MSASVPLPGRNRGRTAGLILGLIVLIAACGGSAQIQSTTGESVDSGTPAEQPSTDLFGANAPRARDDARIIRTGTMQLQVKDVLKAVDNARTAVLDLGGYISASRQATADDGSVVAQITYRIPVDRWEQALTVLRGLALKVLDEQTEAVEVTGEVVDLDARIRNLQASERALQAIAERAIAIKDVLAVQQELTTVRGQIEQLSAQKGDLEDRAALATMTVTFGVEVVAVTLAAKGWDAAAEVDRAAANLVDVLQAVATAGIWFGIVWLPILVVLLILAVVVRVVLRRTGFIGRMPAPTMPMPPDAGPG